MKLLIIGEVFTDFFIDPRISIDANVRLGGVFHAMRASAALDIKYAVAYYSPDYLSQDIQKFGNFLHSQKNYRIGTIDNAPNLILIGNADESSRQKYQNVLSKQAVFKKIDFTISEIVNEFKPTDVLLFPGRFDNMNIINELKKFQLNIYVDLNYDSKDFYKLSKYPFKTVFLSTSTDAFHKYFIEENEEKLVDYFADKGVKKIIIKENRGGSCLIDTVSRQKVEASAIFQQKTIHSVGVGDVYDVAYLFFSQEHDDIKSISFSSWLASYYATTLHYSLFEQSIKLLMHTPDINSILELEGVRAGWFARKKYQIYIAAPDFDYIDRSFIDELQESLEYHNFSPRLPIREFGQVNCAMNEAAIDDIYRKDLCLLDECELMIAVLLNNDQGTLVEVGYYLGKNKPIILFDPYSRLDNMFLEHSCSYVCKCISEVIEKVFIEIGRLIKNGKEF